MDDKNNLEALRHSCAHLLAAAVMELWPNTKRTIGPAIENGFYYDFDFENPISEGDLTKIEKKMAELLPTWNGFEGREVSVDESLKIFKDNPYKIELINEIASSGQKITIFKSGKFEDLCRGGHVKNPSKEIGAFKLLSIAGAYWRGSEKNPMLTRIYGTCWPSKKELDEYLNNLEEAKKRDHRKLGAQLGLWVFSDYVGSGLPLFTQKGALIRRLINEFVEELQTAQEIYQVWTPQIAKAQLFKISGHYDKYRENMFHVRSNYSKEEFFLKPMNCPQHTQIYASQPRSYKDLPIRMSDFAMLYRDEKPGELSGLTRTRSFSQDDCHVFCREDQIIDEMNIALDMTQKIMASYGFSYKYRLSTRDPNNLDKYLGDNKHWEKAEKLAEKILKDKKIDYFIGSGEAAFYAPKLDLIAKDSLGREWQLSTLQIDFVMPERFKLSYVDQNGKLTRPVMLHRAISGSPERLMAILIEHFGGAFPTWLAPVQVIIIPISQKNNKFAQKLYSELKLLGIRTEIDDKNETMQARLRDALVEKVPYVAIVGDREESNLKVNVRKRGEDKSFDLKIDEFKNRLTKEIANRDIK